MEDESGSKEPDSDAEDLEGYFLEPSLCSTSMEERIAEANRVLFEDVPVSESEEKTRKVQFSNLVDFAPDEAVYSTDENDSLSQHSEEEPKEKDKESSVRVENEEQIEDEHDETNETELIERNGEKVINEDKIGQKILLVLLPREQSSSCESLIGDEEENVDENVEETVSEEQKEKTETKVRPKSANRGIKKSRGLQNEKIECKLMPVSPVLNCFFDNEEKNWHESQNVKLRPKMGSKLQKENVEKKRPVSSCEAEKSQLFPIIRPKTAPSKRSCCRNRTDLPQYNGVRSEYGLSAEQLQERKMKNAEIRQQRRNEKLMRQKEEFKKRRENEEKFSSWLEEKTTRLRNRSSSTLMKTDTLVRSDVYIQKHAVYASKCGVSYAVTYPYFGNSKSKIVDIRRKTVNLGKLFESISPHAQRTYDIYVRSSSQS